MPPPGWTLSKTVQLESWKIQSSQIGPHSGDYFGAVDNAYPLANQDEILFSPAFTATSGTLSFFSFGSFDWCHGEVDNCDLEIYYVKGGWDGGIGDDVYLGKADDDWTADWTWSESSYDLSPYTDNTPARIAFRYVGYDGARIGLDDIQLQTSCDMVYDVFIPLILKNFPPLDIPDWTVMIYMAGDNEYEAQAIDDFLEISSVGSTEDVNILVQFDRALNYDDSYGDWKQTLRYWVTNEMIPTQDNAIQDLLEVNMGAEQSLADFAIWGMETFTTEHYALVVWDHGSGRRSEDDGLLAGVAFDEINAEDTLTMDEIRDALDIITAGGTKPIDLFGFDAGLMATVEVDAQLNPYVDVRVGPEDLVAPDGWPYDTILTTLVSTPTLNPAELGGEIVDAYFAFYGNDEIHSAVDLGTPYDNLLVEVDDFSAALMDGIGTYHNQVQTARSATQSFSNTDFIDLYDFAYQISLENTTSEIFTAAGDLMAAIMDTLIRERHGAGWPGAHGVGVYFPETSNNYDTSYDGVEGLLTYTANGQWDEWLNAYYQGGGGDAYEPDGNPVAASTIISAGLQTHSIAPQVDVDWVVFTLTLRSGVVLETSGASGDTRMWLYDSSLTEVEFDDDSGTDSFSNIDRVCTVDSLIPGTYYVKVDGNGAEIPSYDLSLSVTLCEANILNGDFELGQGVGWSEFSTNGWDLVTDTLTALVYPHSGDWATWLGGDEDFNEVSIISQILVVPSLENDLIFWYWIQADIPCGDGYAYVIVDSVIEWTQDICANTSMLGWDFTSVNLSAYAGSTVTLEIKASTIGSLIEDPINQIFIDDVDFVSIP